MAYSPQTWTDGVSKLNATRMTVIETGIDDAHTLADAAQATADAAIAETVVNAKGDLLVATAADTVGRLAVGSNDQVLTADSAQASGVKWATPATSVPAGSITAYAGSSAPTGWLLCDGTAVSRTTYADLFTAISTAYGTGDGSTTFNVPDMRGRMPVGKGTHTDVDALGDSDGVAVASRRPKHAHTVTDSGHTHSVGSGNQFIASAGGSNAFVDQTGSSLFAVAATDSATTGIAVGSSGMTDTAAYLTVNFIIKT